METKDPDQFRSEYDKFLERYPRFNDRTPEHRTLERFGQHYRTITNLSPSLLAHQEVLHYLIASVFIVDGVDINLALKILEFEGRLRTRAAVSGNAETRMRAFLAQLNECIAAMVQAKEISLEAGNQLRGFVELAGRDLFPL